MYCMKKGLPGGMDRVTDDPIEAAYYGVYVWKKAAELAKELRSMWTRSVTRSTA